MVRRALYICAWAVLRLDGDLRDFYQRLRERGKSGKVAVDSGGTQATHAA